MSSATCAPSAAEQALAGAGDTLPHTVDGLAVARLYGQPLFELPQDLYIPPDALEVFLEAFEGPLDLLLYLIRRQDFNILDIPMAQVTRQYLEYVEQIRDSNLELAAEYLLMAAMLIEIKSRMLLPRPAAAEGEQVEDPRAELVRRLLEYERMKLAAQQLDALPQAGRDFWRAQVALERSPGVLLAEVSVDELRSAWAEVLQRARLHARHTIGHEPISLREVMSGVLRQLHDRRWAEFADLFDPSRGMLHAVLTFVALLELAREGLVQLTQAEAYAPLYLRLAYTPS